MKEQIFFEMGACYVVQAGQVSLEFAAVLLHQPSEWGGLWLCITTSGLEEIYFRHGLGQRSSP